MKCAGPAVAGQVDTAKYKDIKITDNLAYWDVVEIDKDGKEVAGSTRKFKLNLYKDNNPPAWDGGSGMETVENPPGVPMQFKFAGFPAGTYKVTVRIKVKDTPTSDERTAVITASVVISP